MGDILILQKLLDFESELELDSFRSVIAKTLTFLSKETEAQNAYWFLGDRLENMMMQEKHGLLKIPRRLFGDSCPQFYALNSKTQDELKPLVAQLSRGLAEISFDDVVHVFLGSGEYVLWPVFTMKTKERIGSILIENPTNWKKSWVFESLSPTSQVISRNLSESLRFVRARELAFVDDLTGLFNQRYLGLALDREISLSQRNKNCFSVLFLDIDKFKEVNDCHGHVIGSKILSQLGQLLRTSIRTNDVGVRYGGDEYLLVLVGANANAGKVAAERIRKLIASKEFIVDGKTYNITTSIGIASFPEHAVTRETLVSLADSAMYQSKNSGRNRIYIAS